MLRDRAEEILLEGVERALNANVPPLSFAEVPTDLQVALRGKICDALGVLGAPESCIQLRDATPPGGGGGGGGQPGSLVGTITNVVGPSGTVTRQLVLGDAIGAPEEIPGEPGVGLPGSVVQRYYGGVTLKAGADVVTIPISKAHEMFPGSTPGVIVADPTGGALFQEVTADLVILATITVTLGRMPQP